MSVPRNPQRKSKRNPKTAGAATTAANATHVYCFGSFCLNQPEQQLWHNGEPVRLAPKAFEVLRVLIENRGRLVTKEKLLQEVWPNVFVEEANLSVNIACLRKALAEHDANQQCIETVPKRGYRFVADVSELRVEGSQAPHNGHSSVAVLPFENEGCGAAGDYLSTALMESITNTLSQSPALRVMARYTVHSCRFKLNPRKMGQRLGVGLILVGRILLLDERLIVRTELVDVMNGWQLWGEQYQTRISDILLTQQELTAQISAAVLAIT